MHDARIQWAAKKAKIDDARLPGGVVCFVYPDDPDQNELVKKEARELREYIVVEE
jgi:hypothetical protein